MTQEQVVSNMGLQDQLTVGYRKRRDIENNMVAGKCCESALEP